MKLKDFPLYCDSLSLSRSDVDQERVCAVVGVSAKVSLHDLGIVVAPQIQEVLFPVADK